MDSRQIRAVIFQDEGVWIAQCIDYDIAAQAPTLSDVRRRLMMTINLERDYTLEKTGEEFGGIAPAPQYFHKLYHAAAGFFQPDGAPETMELRMAA